MAPPLFLTQEKLKEICLDETPVSVTSISTVRHVPQPLENRSHFVCNRLFVGGFPPGTTLKELIKIFSDYGKVIGCNIMSQDTLKNFGFVTFEDVSSAEAVMDIAGKKHVFVVRGYSLKIKRAVFKPKKAPEEEDKIGRHDIVRYYGGTAHFEIIRENTRGFANGYRGVMQPKFVQYVAPAPIQVQQLTPRFPQPIPVALLQPPISAPLTVQAGYEVVCNTLVRPQFYTGVPTCNSAIGTSN